MRGSRSPVRSHSTTLPIKEIDLLKHHFFTTLLGFLKIPFQIGACGKSAARCIPLGSDPTNKLLRRHSGWAVLLWRFAELDRKKLCLVNKGSTCRAGIWKSRWLGRQVTVATQVSINCFSIWKIYTKMISKSPTKSGNGILSGEFVRQGRDIEPNFRECKTK